MEILNRKLNSVQIQKKRLIWIIVGVILISGIGVTTYLVWPKIESKKQEEKKDLEKIKHLQTELNSLQSKLDNLSDNTEKNQLKVKLSNLENQINNLVNYVNQNNSPSPLYIKKLEEEIKRLEEKMETPDNLPPDEEGDKCPYLDALLSAPVSGEWDSYQEKFEKISRDYVVKCWKKGYHWVDIVKLWEWKIPETEIPDLKTEKRIGVIRELAAMPDFEARERDEFDWDNPGGLVHKGISRNLVVICRRIPTGGKVNIDENYKESPMSFYDDENRTRNYLKELINFAFNQEENSNFQQYEVSLLLSFGIEWFQKENEINWGNTTGTSAGSNLYLALISSLQQKPISKQVAATGSIAMEEIKVKKLVSEQEFVLKKGDNIPIGSLKAKATIAAEKGVNRLVLSKYHKVPDILTKTDKYSNKKVSVNYEEKVPFEVRKKMTVYWTGNIQELRKLVLENKLS